MKTFIGILIIWLPMFNSDITFQFGKCLKRPEIFMHTATQTLIIKYTL